MPSSVTTALLAAVWSGALATGIAMQPWKTDEVADASNLPKPSVVQEIAPIIVPLPLEAGGPATGSYYHLMAEMSVVLEGQKDWPLSVPVETALRDILLKVVESKDMNGKADPTPTTLSVLMNDRAVSRTWWPVGAKISVAKIDIVEPR